MISVQTTRKTTLNGQSYAKGDRLSVPKNQFDDLGPDGTGLLERVPAEKPAPAKLEKGGKAG